MYNTVVFDGNCILDIQQDGDCSLNLATGGEFGTFTKVTEVDFWTGPTTFTPSAETQVFETNGYTMPTDIVVNPIPSNYGLITWNGSTLTVS